MNLNAVIDTVLQSILSYGIGFKIFLFVLATLLLNFVLRRILLRAEKRAAHTKTQWDDVFINALKKPLSLLIWMVGLGLIVSFLEDYTSPKVFEYINNAKNVGIIVSFFWFFSRLVRNIEEKVIETKLAEDTKFDKTTPIAISKLVRLALMITAALVVLQTLGISVSGVVAFGGVGGIAVGFAARDLLANFFGGLMIFLDRPFSVGDWVRSPDRNIEGTVDHIGWRLTRIITFEKRPLYVPNSVFTNIIVENPSRMSNRRIKETIGLRYDDLQSMDKIVADVKAMLKEHPAIDAGQTLIVNFNAFNASSADFFIYAFTKTTEWALFHEIKQEVLLEIAKIIEQNGAEMAFPTQTLHVANGEIKGEIKGESTGE